MQAQEKSAGGIIYELPVKSHPIDKYENLIKKLCGNVA